MTSATDLLAYGTATLFEAWPATALINRPLRPIAAGMALAGPAFPVTCRPGDNLALHRAIATAQSGDVLVVDYGGSLESGPFGEIMTLACQLRGIAGLVIDGAVRDSAQIAAAGFPVFCLGLNIRGTAKQDGGTIGAPISIGGAEIRLGDLIVADADAVISICKADIPAAVAAASDRAARETRMMERLRLGETTIQILGLEGVTP